MNSGRTSPANNTLSSRFVLLAPQGDDARRSLSPDAELIWAVEADSHFAAMTAYYKFMDWGNYTTDQEWDMQPYPKEWSQK